MTRTLMPGFVVFALIAIGPDASAASAADAPAVEAALARWIGTAKDGWTPVAFAALRSAMSPAEVGKSFPGAERLIGNGASKVRISGISHVQEAQFDFLKSRTDGQKGLDHVILTFERGFFDDKPRYEALVRVLEAKFGPMRPGPSSLTKGFWMVRKDGQQRMAQLVEWGRGQDLQLSFDFPVVASPAGAAPAAPRVSSTSVFHSRSCRAVELTQDRTIVETSAATMSACNALVKDKLRAARCAAGVESVSYRLQQFVVGRWSNGARLTLSCR